MPLSRLRHDLAHLPSLDFLLMTLGPALLGLAWFETLSGPMARFFVTFGRAPFLFYAAHLMLAHLLAGLVGMAMGFRLNVLGNIFLFYPPTWGFGLSVVYLAWIAVVMLLYPVCQWFARLKRERREWWLSYL